MKKTDLLKFLKVLFLGPWADWTSVIFIGFIFLLATGIFR